MNTKQRLEQFKKLLLEKNQQINLLSRKNSRQTAERLIEEGKKSIRLLKKNFGRGNQKILDIGSGNGFPGILFAVFFPQSNFYLCEKKRKKAEAVKWIAFQCGLSNIQLLCQPAEELKSEYDIILSQASMPLSQISALLKNLLTDSSKAFIWTSEKQLPRALLSFKGEWLNLSGEARRIVRLENKKI